MNVRCALGRHTGHAEGGTMMFTCPRCGRSMWQPPRYREPLRAVEVRADAMIAAGDGEAAQRMVSDAVRDVVGE